MKTVVVRVSLMAFAVGLLMKTRANGTVLTLDELTAISSWSLEYAKQSVCTAGNNQYVPREAVLFLSGFALRPARVMLARHLIGPSFCSEKATRQLCLHLSRFTRVLVAVEDILLVVDASRRARHLEPAAVFERSSWRFATSAPVPPSLHPSQSF